MSTAISNLDALLASMEPVLNEGAYYFSTIEDWQILPVSDVIAVVQEKEGVSVIVSEDIAQKYRLKAQFKSAWITLNVHSDLAAVGLTAAFASALGKANISCNVVAGNYHDHIFVPYEQAELAMETLRALQQQSLQK